MIVKCCYFRIKQQQYHSVALAAISNNRIWREGKGREGKGKGKGKGREGRGV